jgi:gliding motility-associated-like protein
MKKLLLGFSAMLLGIFTANSQTTVTYNYTGSVQQFIVPPCVYSIDITAAGAKGGGLNGGNGATVTGTFAVNPGDILEIYVGGMGSCPGAGYNGGGAGATATGAGNESCGGGGASDVRVAPYALANRIIVAAGGGGMGGGNTDAQAGTGGCATGGNGQSPFGQGGFGGTQTAGGTGGPPWISSGNAGQNGALGIGGAGGSDPCYNLGPGGGGGGGYYGGGGGGSDCFGSGSLGGGGGGGGSSLVPAGGNCTPGNNTGNGVVTITYNPALVLNFSASVVNNITCSSNGSITVNPTGGSGNFSYSWSPGGQTTPSITVTTPGAYTVTVTDNVQNCSIDTTFNITSTNPLSVNISNPQDVTCNGGNNGQATANAVGAMGPVSYSWSPGGQTNQTATGLTAGTYTVTATDQSNGCTATATVTINEPAAVTGTITINNQVSCNGGNNGSATVNAAGGNGTYTYNWSPAGGTAATANNLSAGNYTVTITDGNGCTGTATTTITEPAPLTSTMQSTNVSCNGANNGTATVTPSGGTGPYTYFWPLSSNTTNTQTGMFAGTFTVTVTDANGCQITDTVIITQPAPIQVSSTSTPASCGTSNGTATANVVSGGTGPYSYSWPQSGQTTQTATGLPAGPNNFTVTDANGCTANGVANVGTINDHVAAATANPTNGVVPLTVNFTNNSQNTSTYFWDFGNNSTSTDANPSTTYTSEGTYTVILIATNAGGCSDTAYLTIVVLNESFLLVPNVFSPNGDGINDEFKVQYQYITEFNMTIANRWGTILYETANIDQGWDGKHNGNMCADGTYYYIIKAKGIEGKEYNLSGHLTMFTKKP